MDFNVNLIPTFYYHIWTSSEHKYICFAHDETYREGKVISSLSHRTEYNDYVVFFLANVK